jgi:hypothetical protein
VRNQRSVARHVKARRYGLPRRPRAAVASLAAFSVLLGLSVSPSLASTDAGEVTGTTQSSVVESVEVQSTIVESVESVESVVEADERAEVSPLAPFAAAEPESVVDETAVEAEAAADAAPAAEAAATDTTRTCTSVYTSDQSPADGGFLQKDSYHIHFSCRGDAYFGSTVRVYAGSLPTYTLSDSSGRVLRSGQATAVYRRGANAQSDLKTYTYWTFTLSDWVGAVDLYGYSSETYTMDIDFGTLTHSYTFGGGHGDIRYFGTALTAGSGEVSSETFQAGTSQTVGGYISSETYEVFIRFNGVTYSATRSGFLWAVTLPIPAEPGSYALEFGRGSGSESSTAWTLLNMGRASTVIVEARPITILTPLAGASFDSEVGATSTTVTFTGTGQYGWAVTLTADGGQASTTVGSSGTWTVDMTFTTGGSKSVLAYYTDLAIHDNTFGTATRAITVTMVAVITVTSHSAGSGLFVGSTVTFTGTAQPSRQLSLAFGGLSGQPWVDSSGTWSWTVTVTAVTNLTGRYMTGSSYSFSFGFVERAALIVSSPTAGSAFDAGAVTFSGTASTGSSLYYSVDGGAAVYGVLVRAGSWSVAVSLPTAGEHTVRFWYSDAPERAAERTVVINLAPLTITSPTGSLTSVQGQSVAFAGTGHSGASVQYSVDGETWGSITPVDGAWSLSLDGLTVGTRTVKFWYANYADAATQSRSVTVLAPIVVSSPAEGARVDLGTVAFSGTGEASRYLNYSIDGGTEGFGRVGADGSWTLNLPLSTVGAHTVSFWYSGFGDLAVTRSVQVSWADLVLTSPGADELVVLRGSSLVLSGTGQSGKAVAWQWGEESGTASVSGTAWSQELTFDSGGWQTITFSYVEDPSVTLAVRVRVLSALTVTSPAAGSLVPYGSTAEFTGTGHSGASVMYRVDSGAVQGPITPVSSAWSLSVDGLAEGSHTLTVWYADLPDASLVTLRVTVLTPIVVESPAEGARVEPGVVVFSGTSGVRHIIYYSIDGGEALYGGSSSGSGTWNISVSLPTVGVHTVSFWYTRAYGDAATVTRSLQVAWADLVLTSPGADELVVLRGTSLVLSGTGQSGEAVAWQWGDTSGEAVVDGTTWSQELTFDSGGWQTITFSYVEDPSVTLAVRVRVLSALTVTSPTEGSAAVAGSAVDFAGGGHSGVSVMYSVDGGDAQGPITPVSSAWSQAVDLAEGSHTVTFWYADLPDASLVSRTVVVLAPIVVATPAEGGTVEPGTVEFSGTGHTGQTIAYSVDGGSTTQGAEIVGGSWTIGVALATAGEHTVTFWYTDLAADVSTVTRSVQVSWAALVLTSPGADELVVMRGTSLVLSGTGQSGKTVAWQWGDVSGEAAVDGAAWSQELTFTGAGWQTITFSYVEQPETTLAVRVRVLSTLTVTSPAQDGYVEAGSVGFAGGGHSGTAVMYSVDGGDAQGPITPVSSAWSQELDLAAGSHTVAFWYADLPDASLVSRTVSVLSRVVISTPVDGALLLGGSGTVISGTATPGDLVVTIDGGSGVQELAVTADESGAWSVQADLSGGKSLLGVRYAQAGTVGASGDRSVYVLQLLGAHLRVDASASVKGSVDEILAWLPREVAQAA